jgi:hypothetical protein
VGAPSARLQQVRPFASPERRGFMLIPARSFWGLVADGLPPQDAEALKEDLGIEPDSDAHTAVDKSTLCVPRRGR